MRRIGLATMLGGLLAIPLAHAADPAPQAEIHGADVMGDKGRTGPDGWSWAPVTRSQAPGDKSGGPDAARAQNATNTKPGPNEGKALPPGEDPGTPAAAATAGPGTMDASPAAKP